MPSSGGRRASEVCCASVDVIIAALAGSLIVLVFYPITLCATGVKKIARAMRPHLVSQRNRDATSAN